MKVHSIFLCCWTSSILLLANFGVADAALLSSTTREEQVANTATNLRGADNLNENKKPKSGKLLDLDLYAEAINAIFYGNYTPAETKQIIDHVGRNFVRADVVDPEKTDLAFAFEKVPRKLRDISCVRGKGCECPDDTFVDCVCTLGYVSDGEGGCRDYDECANDAPCAPFELGGFCVDTDPDNTEFPMYKCGCDPNRGFQDGSVIDPVHGPLSCAAKDFVDTNECSTGEHDCDSENGICANDPLGTFTCSCKENFDLSDGNKCTPVVESVEQPCGGKCDPANQFCDSSDGKCVCVQGFFAPSGRGGACQLILNCETANGGCDKNAVCADRETDILCTCRSGYGGNGLQCTENNECTNGVASCDANADCINFDGGFSCVCQDGFTDTSPLVDGTACTDVDECNLETDNCDTNASCTNTIGLFTCSCNPGFNGDGVNCAANIIENVVNVPSTGGSGGPVDPNQCTDNTNNCHPDAVCTNTNSGVGFTCACMVGFIGDGILSCRSTCKEPFYQDGDKCVLLDVDNDLTTFTVLVQGDFDGSNDDETVKVKLTKGNGDSGGKVLLGSTDFASHCPTVPQGGKSFPVSAAQFNGLIEDSKIGFQLKILDKVRICKLSRPRDFNNENTLTYVLTTIRGSSYVQEADEVCVMKECQTDGDCGNEEFCTAGAEGKTTCQVDTCKNDGDCPLGDICLRGQTGVTANKCYTPGVCGSNPGFQSLAELDVATQLVVLKDALPNTFADATGVRVQMPFEFDFFFIGSAGKVLQDLFLTVDGAAFILDLSGNVEGALLSAFDAPGPSNEFQATRIYTLEKDESFLISWESVEGGEYQIELFTDGRFNFVWGNAPDPFIASPSFISGFGATDGSVTDVATFRPTEGADFVAGETLLWPTGEFRCHAKSNLKCLFDSDCGTGEICVTDDDFSTSCVAVVACPTTGDAGPAFMSLANGVGVELIPTANRGPVSIQLPFFFRALLDPDDVGAIIGASVSFVSLSVNPRGYLSSNSAKLFFADVAFVSSMREGKMYTLDKGESFLISWEDMRVRNSDADKVNFQLEIFKDGRVFWIYGDGILSGNRVVKAGISLDKPAKLILPIEGDNIIVDNGGDPPSSTGRIFDWPTDKFACASFPDALIPNF